MNLYKSLKLFYPTNLIPGGALTGMLKVMVVFLMLSLYGCPEARETILPIPFLYNGPGLSSGPFTGSKQGQSVAFADYDGDGIADKLVGAPYYDNNTSVGAVLVYKGTATGYETSYAVKLTGGNNFGWAVENIGDVDGDSKKDFAVGAIHGTSANTSVTSLTGTVTVYKGSGNGAVIRTVSGVTPMSRFGFSLAGGDLNGDGKSDLIVGAPFASPDSSLYMKGAVYVYFGGTTFPSTPSKTLNATSTNGALANNVESGDIDGDGIDDLLISGSSRVLVYFGNGSFSPVVDTPDITYKSTNSSDRRFGNQFAVVGDIDGVAGEEIVIGAEQAIVSYTLADLSVVTYDQAGSVFVLTKGAGTIDVATPPAELIVRLNGAGPLDRFGSAIESLGDIDADGKGDFAVGAPTSDATGWFEQFVLGGNVYVFKGSNISAAATLSNSKVFEGQIKDQFYGSSMAISPRGELLIGGPKSNRDTGGVDMVDPLNGGTITSGSSGGSAGSGGECH